MRDLLTHPPMALVPERVKQGGRWRHWLRHYRPHLLAGAFCTVETAWLKPRQGLFFLEIGRRRVPCAGGTAQPTAAGVVQPARQRTGTLPAAPRSRRFVIHDRDPKFPPRCASVFAAEGIAIGRTPYRTPRANALAERSVRSVREEVLDKLLIRNQARLRRVVIEDVDDFNQARPHQGIAPRCPLSIKRGRQDGTVKRRDGLGGMIHDDDRAAA